MSAAPGLRSEYTTLVRIYNELLEQSGKGGGVTDKEISAFEATVDALKIKILARKDYNDKLDMTLGDGDWKFFNESPGQLDEMKAKIHGLAVAQILKAPGKPDTYASLEKDFEEIRDLVGNKPVEIETVPLLIGRIDSLIGRIAKFRGGDQPVDKAISIEVAVVGGYVNELKQIRDRLEFFQSQAGQREGQGEFQGRVAGEAAVRYKQYGGPEEETDVKRAGAAQADEKAGAAAGKKKVLTEKGLEATFVGIQRSYVAILSQMEEGIPGVVDQIQQFSREADSLKADVREYYKDRRDDDAGRIDIPFYPQELDKLIAELEKRSKSYLEEQEAANKADAEWEEGEDFGVGDVKEVRGRERANDDADRKPPEKGDAGKAKGKPKS